MGYAIVCGSIAGKVAAVCASRDQVTAPHLQEYETQWRKRYGEEFSRALKLRDLLVQAEDETLDKLAGLVTGESVVRMAAAKKVKIFLKATATKDSRLIALMNGLRKLRMV
jgi:flavin-dependent dehydrogenase